MLPISVCIISKNEESFIEECLQKLSHYSWEIIVTDTGSTDNTVSIAKHFTPHIHHFDWCNDFGAARNYCNAKAANDWVLNIDCDEFLTFTGSEKDLAELLLPYLCSPEAVGMVAIQNPQAAHNAGLNTEYVARLFHKRYYSYSGTVHEQPKPFGKYETIYRHLPLAFYHVGYSEATTLAEKANRNIKLLKKELLCNPSDPYLYFQLGQSYFAAGDMQKAYQTFDKGLSFEVNPELQYVKTMVESYGYSLLNLKLYEQALSLEGIYDTFSNHADFVFLMGLIYMNNALFDNAIATFKKATTINDYSVEGVNSYLAFYNIGVILECSNQKKEASKYYLKCGSYSKALEALKRLAL